MMKAIVKAIPGRRPSKLDFDMTSVRSKGSNNSYSLAATLA